MSDIVQKLRDRKQAVAWSRGQDTDYPTKWEEDVLCQQAAEEIETLRTSLAHWKVFAEHAEGERSRLREELECVRQALPEMWRGSVISVAVSTLAAESAVLKDATK